MSRLAGWREEHILGRGTFNERWLFGQLTTSIYSNADLVANYEGYRFYRSLFEDGVVPGKPAIVRFAGDAPGSSAPSRGATTSTTTGTRRSTPRT